VLAWLADSTLVPPSTNCQGPGEVQGNVAFGKNESNTENKLNLSRQTNWEPLWGHSPHSGGFSFSMDIVVFDSSSVLLKGSFQI